MSEAGPQVNGPASPSGKFIDTIDPDDPEYRRNLQRPAEVKEDMKQMEGRSRVSVVLNSQAFREELEEIIHEQMRTGGPASIFTLQQISDLLTPQARGGSSFGRSSPVIPINDIRGVETLGYSKQEKVLRCKLAACYRLVDLQGWCHGIFNHISARVSQDSEQFLVNPFGMLYSEITASTLVKVDVRGEIVDTGSTGLGISKAGFTLHSAIHQARPDIKCIIHLHTPAAVAVSSCKPGLLPLSQESLICGKVSYHEYRGILVDQEERDTLARNLGPFNKVMFLRNHGVVACGETIEEAFHYAFNVMAACEAQVQAMPVGLDNLVLVDEETQEKTFKIGSQGGGGTDTSGRKWRCGELEWEALMRTLDNSGYRTGHVYKQPLMKQEKKERSTSDVEVPPASSSFTYVFDGDYEHSKYVSPIKLAMERQKAAYKAGWLTSPNTYKKTEIEEIGTTTPKKITKWVQDGEQAQHRSTAMKIENPNQFAPQGANPREFKEKQKSIRKDYYEEKVTPGPQSKILEGLSWDEAAKIKEGGDQTIVVGAASKGIIQRDHQHNAVVYRSYYAANPFENMSEEEMKAYKRDVERHERGEEPEDAPGPEGRLISTEERMQQIQRSREDVDRPDTEDEAHETNLDSVANGEREPRRERSPEPVASPKEPRASATTLARDGLSVPANPFPPALTPTHQDEGLHQLADSVVQAVMASALPTSLSKGQLPPAGDGRVAGAPQPQSLDSHLILVADPDFGTVLPLHIETPSPKQGPPQNAGFAVKAEVKSGEEQQSMTAKVKTNTVKLDVPIERADADAGERPESMRVELQPLKLFQGKPGDGVMKISFTIHSTVTRRKVKGPKRSWPIENVTITQSEPKIMFVKPEEDKAQPGKKRPRILQEQQNVIITPDKDNPGDEAQVLKLPLSPTHKPSGRRYPQAQGRKLAVGRLGRRRRKAFLKRGLQHPLSPVREEFVEGEETLESLLARQNVEVDSDESLDDLLLRTDNYKENLAPSPTPESDAHAQGRFAPIASIDDEFEDTSAEVKKDSGEEPVAFDSQDPVFIVPKITVTHPSPKYPGNDMNLRVPASPSKPQETSGTIPCESSVDPVETPEVTKVEKEKEDEIKFADEDVSNNNLEAADGDVKPRKQEESQAKPQVREQQIDSDQSSSVSEEDQQDSEEEEEMPVAATKKPDEASFSFVKKEMTPPKEEIVTAAEAPRQFSAAVPQVVRPAPIKLAPKAEPEDDLDFADDVSPPAGPVTSSPREGATKTDLYRTSSASLETSPIVSSPPPDSQAPELPVHRQLHQTQSLEAESRSRPPEKSQPVIRRSYSAGSFSPARSSGGTHKNRNVAVIDAVLHTVTIDPARVAESGRPVSSILPRGEAGDKKQWSLMDSISKSLEELDVDANTLVKKGGKIYGRSLEILIHDHVPETEQKPESPLAQPPIPEVVTDKEEDTGKDKKSTKLYKDDVVIVTSPQMDFGAIPPKTKKDLASTDEGPLQTSSPKLGRRKEGSFKKYQHKMGKSEETLLEVTPVHTLVSRSKSFPRGAEMKMHHRHTIVDDGASLKKSDSEKPAAGSLDSMAATDQSRRQRGRRHRSRDALRSDPSLHAGEQGRGRHRSHETLLDGPPTGRSPGMYESSKRRSDRQTDEYRGSSRPQEGAEEEQPSRRRRRRRAPVDEESDARNNEADENEPPRLRRSDRRRRRQQRSEERLDREPEEKPDLEEAGQYRRERESYNVRDREKDRERGKDVQEEIVRADSAPVESAHKEKCEKRSVAPVAADSVIGQVPPDSEDFPPPPEDLPKAPVIIEGVNAQVPDSSDLPPPPADEEDVAPPGTRRARRSKERRERRSQERRSRDRHSGRASSQEPEPESEPEPEPEDTSPPRQSSRNQEEIEEPKVEMSSVLSSFQQPVRAEQTLGEDFPSLSSRKPPEKVEKVPVVIEMDNKTDVPLVEEILNLEEEPPRVRRPHPSKKQHVEDRVEGSPAVVKEADADREKDSSFHSSRSKEETDSVKEREDAPFMSSFKQPVHAEQTLGTDFPSLVSKPKKETAPEVRDTAAKDKQKESDRRTSDDVSKTQMESPASVGSNLDLMDYGDEPPRVRRSRRRQQGEGDRDGAPTSRAQRREERRARQKAEDEHDDRSVQSREDRMDIPPAREIQEVEREPERELPREGPPKLDDMDIISYDDDYAPPRVRRSRQRLDKIDDDDRSERGSERPRSEGRVRGRREARNFDDRDSNTAANRSSEPPPMIRVLGSRDQLIDEDDGSAPSLPPKKHRSMELLVDVQSGRARSYDSLHRQHPGDQDRGPDVPPELPPKKKKNKGMLACVSGADADTKDENKKKQKDRSSSKDRKKMPPPPPPPEVDRDYNEEPRRRGVQQSREPGRYLQVPRDDSFRRDTSFDDVDHDKWGSSYYADTEDEDEFEHSFRRRDLGRDREPRDQHRPDAFLDHTHSPPHSPPHTPKSIRRQTSRDSQDDGHIRPRSVSFSDGYTPTMTNPPRRGKSRESLASESSFPSGYRLRSHSAASETSMASNRSNPLTYDPWRAKAAASRSSRPRRSRSQGEATYSANAGRRRRSRTPDANRLYQPRKSRSRSSLHDAPPRSAAPSHGHSHSRDPSLLADDSFSDAHSHGYASEPQQPAAPVRRSESERQPERNPALIKELERKGVGRSKSDRRERGEDAGDGDKPGSPSKSDPMDSASGGETLEEHSSKEGSPTKEAPSPKKEKKKKKFRMPSFSKKKKDSKESTI